MIPIHARVAITKPRGYLVYRGGSRLNGKPIAVVALIKSNNEKTGDVVQTYILADNGERPTEALKSGSDASVCGDCKHRPANNASCYVVVRQGATVVWQQLQAGAYPDARRMGPMLPDLFENRFIRIGTYGDPAAVPVQVWRELTEKALGWVGYTHQWKSEIGFEYRPFCMASVDTPEEKVEAIARGWRTFRVRLPDESLDRGESVCPASIEGGHKLQCAQCKACNGGQRRKGNIAIVVHGAKLAHQPYARYVAWREGMAA